MNLKMQRLWTFIISVLSLIGFGLMTFLITQYDTLTFDSVIITFIQGLETPIMTVIMKFFTEIGSTNIIVLMAIFIMIFLFIVFKHRSELVLLTIVYIGERMLNRFLKEFFGRPRPDINPLIEVGGYSFPSGHAMNAMAFYGILTFLLWSQISTRWGRTLLILISSFIILMIGISRIYLGVHYPSDVVAGYFASGFLVAMAIWLYENYQQRRHTRNKIKILS